jgi:hypothetical protein
MLRRRGCAPFVSPSLRKPRCRPNPRIATVANRPKTKTPGVYVAHQRRCPAFKSAARRAAGAFARDVDPVRIAAIGTSPRSSTCTRVHAHVRERAAQLADQRPRRSCGFANTTELDAKRLDDAIDEIFSRRGTRPRPTALPAPPNDWAAGWRRLVTDLPADAEVDAEKASRTHDPRVGGSSPASGILGVTSRSGNCGCRRRCRAARNRARSLPGRRSSCFRPPSPACEGRPPRAPRSSRS